MLARQKLYQDQDLISEVTVSSSFGSVRKIFWIEQLCTKKPWFWKELIRHENLEHVFGDGCGLSEF